MRKYLFSDESGCLTFESKKNVSRYFILCTVAAEPDHIGPPITSLRRQLAWEGHRDDECIHATSDPQAVRDRVFALIQTFNIRVDATILDKPKALPKIRKTEDRFYQYAWYYHFKHISQLVFNKHDEAFICASQIGTRKKKVAFRAALNDVVQQTIPSMAWRTSFWPTSSDPCLLIADYCAWAIQRKWEHGDARSHALIANKIATEFDLWRSGNTQFY